jgi:hypothetical protein
MKKLFLGIILTTLMISCADPLSKIEFWGVHFGESEKSITRKYEKVLVKPVSREIDSENIIGLTKLSFPSDIFNTSSDVCLMEYTFYEGELIRLKIVIETIQGSSERTDAQHRAVKEAISAKCVYYKNKLVEKYGNPKIEDGSVADFSSNPKAVFEYDVNGKIILVELKIEHSMALRQYLILLDYSNLEKTNAIGEKRTHTNNL